MAKNKIKKVDLGKMMEMQEKGQIEKMVRLVLTEKVEIEAVKIFLQTYCPFEELNHFGHFFETYVFNDIFSSFEDYVGSPLAKKLYDMSESGMALSWIEDFPTQEELKELIENVSENDKQIIYKNLLFRQRGLSLKDCIANKYVDSFDFILGLIQEDRGFTEEDELIYYYLKWSPVLNKKFLERCMSKLSEISKNPGYSIYTGIAGRLNLSNKLTKTEMQEIIFFALENKEIIQDNLIPLLIRAIDVYTPDYSFSKENMIDIGDKKEEFVALMSDSFSKIGSASTFVDVCMLTASYKELEDKFIELANKMLSMERPFDMWDITPNAIISMNNRVVRLYSEIIEFKTPTIVEDATLKMGSRRSIIFTSKIENLNQLAYLFNYLNTTEIDKAKCFREVGAEDSITLKQRIEYSDFSEEQWKSMGISELLINPEADLSIFNTHVDIIRILDFQVPGALLDRLTHLDDHDLSAIINYAKINSHTCPMSAKDLLKIYNKISSSFLDSYGFRVANNVILTLATSDKDDAAECLKKFITSLAQNHELSKLVDSSIFCNSNFKSKLDINDFLNLL